MRLLANENFPGAAVEALRSQGHDVGWIREDAPGSPDLDVMARAVAEDRLLLTFDKDFGELAFRHGLPGSSGIVLLRICPRSAAHVARFVVALLELPGPWVGSFSVVEEDRIRRRTLPGTPASLAVRAGPGSR